MDKEINVDVIILSFALSPELRKITESCLSSLLESQVKGKIKFNIIVIESQKDEEPYRYENTVTVYPEVEFGYHTYMNIGIGMTSSPFICLCNNDLVFHPQWATEMVDVFLKFDDLSSASPICSIHHPKNGFNVNSGIYLGYRIRSEVSGWCLFLRRDILRYTGKLDENFRFWCADDDYANTLWALKLKHALITSSVVDHLETQTLITQNQERKEDLTEKSTFYFEKKWNHRLGINWKLMT